MAARCTTPPVTMHHSCGNDAPSPAVMLHFLCGVCKCFFKYLKKEELNRRHFHSLDQLKQSLLTYIDGFYNPIRPHSHNLGLSPVQAENYFFQLFTCPNS